MMVFFLGTVYSRLYLNVSSILGRVAVFAFLVAVLFLLGTYAWLICYARLNECAVRAITVVRFLKMSMYVALSILYIQKFFGSYHHDRIAWSDKNDKE